MRNPGPARLLLGALLLWTVPFTMGCGDASRQNFNPVLMQVGSRCVTLGDFKSACELTLPAYAASDLRDASVLHQIQLMVLSQLRDELVLMNRAEELGLTVTAEELAKAVADIQEDYPGDTFSRTLRDAAIPFGLWREGLKKRMLLEKVIQADLEGRASIVPGDIDRYFDQAAGTGRGSKNMNTDAGSVMRRLRREKAQTAYRSWMNDLRGRYAVTINEELLENINRP